MSGSRDRTIKLWNPHRGALVTTFRGHSGDVRALAIAADNSKFMSGGDDRHINLWDVATANTIRRFHGHDAAVNDVLFAAEEALVVSGSYDSTVAFWDLRGRAQRALQTVKVASDAVSSIALAAQPYVFAASIDGTLSTIDIRKGCIVADQVHHAITSIAAPPGGEYILAACMDNTLRLLDRATGKVLAQYGGHQHSSFQLQCALLCRDAVAAVGSEDGAYAPPCCTCSVHTWHARCRYVAHMLRAAVLHRFVARVKHHVVVPLLMCASHGGPTFAIVCAGRVLMFDITSKELLSEVQAHKGVAASICGMNKDGIMYLLSAGADGVIKVWQPMQAA